MSSLLDFLRSHSTILCDTFDPAVGKELGPFAGCTSNQFIAHFLLTKDPETCASLLHEAMQHIIAIEENTEKRVSGGVKLVMILLAQKIVPYLTEGSEICIQSSMRQAWSTSGTFEDAREIISLARSLPGGGESLASRIVVKIPSTFEALSASPALAKEHGIRTLGTTLFTLEQGVLAHEVGCALISPYLNELRVHFTPGFVDENKLFGVIDDIWRYYRAEDIRSETKVMPASFTNADEILALTGVDNLTIPPLLLQGFAAAHITPDSPAPPLKDAFPRQTPPVAENPRFAALVGLAKDETRYKSLFSQNAEAVRKLDEAIATFLGFEEKLEALVRAELEKA